MGSEQGRNDPYAAFCFDEAVWIFGSTIESELEQAKHEAKTQPELDRRVGAIMSRVFTPKAKGPNSEVVEKGTFRDPADLF